LATLSLILLNAADCDESPLIAVFIAPNKDTGDLHFCAAAKALRYLSIIAGSVPVETRAGLAETIQKMIGIVEKYPASSCVSAQIQCKFAGHFLPSKAVIASLQLSVDSILREFR
jgi:hypothetical protein